MSFWEFWEESSPILGIAFLVLIVCLIFLAVYFNNDVKELGHAICEEEYGMDFESYDVQGDNVLKCKPFKEKYDGLKVEIGGKN